MLGIGLNIVSVFFSVQYAKELTQIKRDKERGKSAEETPKCTSKISTEPLWRIWKDSEQVQTWVAKVFDDKADGAFEGEMAQIWGKNTKYFLSKEKRNHTKKHIRKLCLSRVITTNYEKILDSSSKYFKNLYSTKVNTVQPDILGHFLGQARITK